MVTVHSAQRGLSDMGLVESLISILATIVCVAMTAMLITHFAAPTLVVCCAVIPFVIAVTVKMIREELDRQRQIRKIRK